VNSKKLSVATKFYYGFGSISYGIKDNGYSYFVLFVYSVAFGLPGWMTGLALNIVLIFDAFSDPLVGYFSDRTESKWGRRHPFMYAAALPVAISYFFLWNPPSELTDWQLFSYLLFLSIVIRTFITFFEIPSTSLGPELTSDYVERAELLSYRYFFGWFGGLTLYNLVWVWFAPRNQTAEYLDGRYNPATWTEYGLVASFLILAGILVTSIGTHRHIPNLLKPPSKKISRGDKNLRERFNKFKSELKETLLSERSYVFLFIASLLGAIASGLESALAIYFDSFFWQFTLNEMLIRGVSIYLAPIIAIILVPLLVNRFGKKRTVMGVWLIQIFYAASPFTLRLMGLFPDNNSPFLLPILCFHAVTNVAMAIIVASTIGSMVMDLVEKIQLRTGRREEGLLISARSFAQKAVSGFGLAIAGLILSIISFPSGITSGSVPQETLDLLAMTYIPVSVFAFLLALSFVTGYNLSRQNHEENIARPETKVWIDKDS